MFYYFYIRLKAIAKAVELRKVIIFRREDIVVNIFKYYLKKTVIYYYVRRKLYFEAAMEIDNYILCINI